MARLRLWTHDRALLVIKVIVIVKYCMVPIRQMSRQARHDRLRPLLSSRAQPQAESRDLFMIQPTDGRCLDKLDMTGGAMLDMTSGGMLDMTAIRVVPCRTDALKIKQGETENQLSVTPCKSIGLVSFPIRSGCRWRRLSCSRSRHSCTYRM